MKKKKKHRNYQIYHWYGSNSTGVRRDARRQQRAIENTGEAIVPVHERRENKHRCCVLHLRWGHELVLE